MLECFGINFLLLFHEYQTHLLRYKLPRGVECGIMFHLTTVIDWLTAKSEAQGLVIDHPDTDPKY